VVSSVDRRENEWKEEGFRRVIFFEMALELWLLAFFIEQWSRGVEGYGSL
jgi:hypothetical protein